ncbi:MAG: HAD family hydrolase [Spirochaetota bacterium]
MIQRTEAPRAGIEAVIYDLDATLLDTEENWYLADRRVMSGYGIDFTKEMKERYIGISIGDMIDDLRVRYGITADPDEIRHRKNACYLEIALGNTYPFPRMKEFYDRVRSDGYPTAIASGTAYHVITALLEDLHIQSHFQHIVSADHVKRGKPAPDIYLETASRLGVRPQNILVLEDSVHGVRSALDAGMNCIAIPYLHGNGLDEGFTDADLIFEGGMHEFSHEAVFAWMNRNSSG